MKNPAKRTVATPEPSKAFVENDLMLTIALYAIESKTNEYMNENLNGRSFGKWKA